MKANPPFFSIITPVHNGEKYIKRFFIALMAQKFSSWELVVVNDHSDDNSHALLSHWAGRDSRIKYFSHYPCHYRISGIKGPYAPRNFAIDNAVGQYVCFLDVDDYWLPDKLICDFAEIKINRSLDLLYSNCFLLYSQNRCVRRVDLAFMPEKVQIYFSNPIPNLTSCLSRESLGNIRFEPIPHEDYVFWFSILKDMSPSSIFKHSKPLSVHTVSPTTLSGNKFSVLQWWLLCYRRFGHSRLKAILFLFFRIVMYFVESCIYASGLRGVDSQLVSFFGSSFSKN